MPGFALFEALDSALKESIPLIEVNANIDDPAFADKVIGVFVNLVR